MRILNSLKSWSISLALTLLRLLGTLVTLGFSLLPLSTLLVAYPALNPQESVLSDSLSESRSLLRNWLRRIFAVFAALVVLLALMASSVELTSRAMEYGALPAKGQFAEVAVGILNSFDKGLSKSPVSKLVSEPLANLLPPAMIQHWPVVLLLMYLGDIALLISIGRVPLSYNRRNILVRWKVTSLTLFAFCFVVGLLVFMLGFVNGMNNLTENTGIPSNVFVLSEGATDELFSNLGYGDVGNIERATTDLDPSDRPIRRTVGVKYLDQGGKKTYLASRETYYVINMAIPKSDPPRRRFVQLRTMEDAAIAATVHNMELQANGGSRWFSDAGSTNGRIECVLGEGIASTLGADLGKPQLMPGDEFVMGDLNWLVVGVMKSEGTTFGSEIWAKRTNLITKPFGKESYTTLVMRIDVEGSKETQRAASQALAYELSKRYTQQKLKAFSEPDYYAELTKTNNQFLNAIILLAVVMSIGGVFGMMTTMFASINQRIRDIGVLRLLGFKRWQVLVSFMIESLTVALVGGAAGVFIGWAVGDGQSATSTLSSGGGGGGKNFAVKLDIDGQIMAAGLLLTLVMGRLGGLVPALSAMRLKVLDSLR
jgi:ABC-type lipoprotein release transport system permease subunit